ncbi:hypothetical protein [Streptomyces sp. NPDC060194]|uniref:hypothetical protein n=1 Tax=Streptomyces sp. NPDC060194 TaxID=3347069 RepID=UPI0036477DA9
MTATAPHADPVKALLDRHRTLCERAVDPLEIAAGLEAHGVTDRSAAARFRHRDVFSLAEELYARVPRPDGNLPAAAPAADAVRPRDARAAWWAVRAMTPGAVTALALLGVRHTDGNLELALLALGLACLLAALHAVVREGPLHAADATGTGFPILWLLGYAVLGDGLLAAGLSDDMSGMWTVDTGPLLGLAIGIAPALWCAHLWRARARRRLAVSRGLTDFGLAVRPLLVGTFLLQVAALTALLWPVAHTGPVVALGALLYLARLLAAHGSVTAAVYGLTVAAGTELLALCAVFAARLPGCAPLARPVEAAVSHWGTGVVPALACGVAALGLLVHAGRVLSRASAHSRGADAAGPSHP